MLCHPNGDPFCTGETPCEIRPVRHLEDANRILVQVEIEGFSTTAVIDTGGVYLIANPEIAQSLPFDPEQAISECTLSIRGVSFSGRLHRGVMTIDAENGNSLQQEVTIFVPNATEEEWGELPTFLGLTGCLEFLRFAVDPQLERFYFASA